MKKKEFLTEAKRKAIIADKEKAIIESFAKTFNKIKRIDENEVNENWEEDWELEDRKQEYGINPEIDPADLEYGELSEEGVDEQAIIPNEIFQNETYDYDHWEVINFNYGSDDSVLEFNFLQTETDNPCFYLKAIFNFYYKISGSYRAATWGYNGGSPEEYPEEEFIPDLKEIIYVECSTGQEYKLTEEMKKIAIPQVIKAFDGIESEVSEQLWDEVHSWGPDGD